MRTLMGVALAAVMLQKDPASTKEAMRGIQFLVGEWKVTVTDENDNAKSWEEEQAWEYKIEKDEYGLQFTVKEGRKFKEGLLSYDVKRKLYRLEASRPDGKKAAFEGKLAGKELVLDEVVDEKSAQERMGFNFLRDNRFLGSYERREAGGKSWAATHAYQFTKKGVPFVRSEAPKCVVTGGTGSISVDYQGKTYYVC
jgi:hypothetical protein